MKKFSFYGNSSVFMEIVLFLWKRIVILIIIIIIIITITIEVIIIIVKIIRNIHA